jgi:hypothetical protein
MFVTGVNDSVPALGLQGRKTEPDRLCMFNLFCTSNIYSVFVMGLNRAMCAMAPYFLSCQEKGGLLSQDTLLPLLLNLFLIGGVQASRAVFHHHENELDAWNLRACFHSSEDCS